DADEPVGRRQALVFVPVEALRPEAVLAAAAQQGIGEGLPRDLVTDRRGGDQRARRTPEDLLGLVVDVRGDSSTKVVLVLAVPEHPRDQQDPGFAQEQRRVARLGWFEGSELDVVGPRAEELNVERGQLSEVEARLREAAPRDLGERPQNAGS